MIEAGSKYASRFAAFSNEASDSGETPDSFEASESL